MNIYVTSLNKDCGKTVISAGITAVMQSLGYNSSFYKPIQTSAIDKGQYLVSSDLTFVKMLDPYITTHSTYMTSSSTLTDSDIEFDIEEIKRDYSILSKKAETIVIEAPCNLMTPINKEASTYHIPLSLKTPIVFILTPEPDTIGQYISEIYTARSLGLDIRGAVINKYSVSSDSKEIKSFPNMIEKYTDVKILGLIRNFKGKSVQANVLISEILNGIDLQELFNMQIPKLNIYD